MSDDPPPGCPTQRLTHPRLVSGGADGTIKLWDLEQCPNPNSLHTYRPVLSVPRAEANSTAGHRFSVTHLSFFPFDELAFLSSSFDQTLKLWSTATAQVSGSFDLGSKVYTHATSPIAPHLLVACGTQHPAVRLVDLRSSAAIQSLLSPGQTGSSSGAVLSVVWSPIHEHVLASGSTDGAVRIWDIRRSNALVGLLDQEDSLGILHPGRLPAPDASNPAAPSVIGRGIRMSAKAHTGPVNGLTWTDSGTHLVSAGHDRRVRVWDAATGANTLANFGPTLRNAHVGGLTMFVAPEGLAATRRDLLFYPSESEILVMDLHEGTIVTRLRGAGPTVAAVAAHRGERAVRNRVTSSMSPLLFSFTGGANHPVSRLARRRGKRQRQRRRHGRPEHARRDLQRSYGRADSRVDAAARGAGRRGGRRGGGGRKGKETKGA